MGLRVILTVLAKFATPFWLRVMGIMAIVPAVGFAIIYAGDLRSTGPEVFGDKIWWNDLQPVHSVLWGGFAILAILRIRQAWTLLALDTALGLVAFIGHHAFAPQKISTGI